jgi:site-specific DNA-methyltransferase (adenine-specific)
MEDAFPGLKIEVVGEPVDLAGAAELAANDPYQFQWWALDRGIDGVIPFLEGRTSRRRVLVSVKGGGTNSSHIRDLKGVLEREKEPMGVLVTLRPPSREMTLEAVAAGHWESEFWGRKYPKIQILTIADIMNGVKLELPPRDSAFARAEREKQQQGEQPSLLG